MHRLLTMMPLVAALAGCSEVLSSGPEQGLQQYARASFPKGGVADVIRVDALDTLPLRTAELVAPDGSATPASFVQAKAVPQERSGTTVYNSTWLAHSSTVDAPPAVFNPPPTAAMYSETSLLLTVSTADLPLPDPVAYRRDWAQYRIRLGFAAPAGRVEPRELAAPEPPPQPTQ